MALGSTPDRPRWLTSVTRAPARAAITAAIPPTTPVAPKTCRFSPLIPSGRLRRRARSTTATMAPAVVKAPDGSTMTETVKGGNMALRAASIMSSATSASRPPMNSPVRAAFAGSRENMASWVMPATSSGATPV